MYSKDLELPQNATGPSEKSMLSVRMSSKEDNEVDRI